MLATTKPTDTDRIRRWAINSGPATLEFQLPGAVRRGNLVRVRIIREVLAQKTERRLRLSQRPALPCRPHQMRKSWMSIAEQVAAAHGVAVKDMLSGSRVPRLATARWELWFLLHERGISLAEIGRRTGGYHHTTVMYGVGKWAERVEKCA